MKDFNLYILEKLTINKDTKVNEKIVNKRINLVSIVTFLAVFITTSFMLYLTFTPVGEINLLGYQPRYITPILPIIVMLLNDKRFISKSSDEKQKNIVQEKQFPIDMKNAFDLGKKLVGMN